ncbi:beta-galactosidase [Lapillicoccus sp.]|uniref:beta-galactosidase n=1 Tax=Lapillicoccus sp. TaxID=1909287 RepID=UPI0025EA2BBA|nr:beta-galactosidase [Lapillicoccus sp.]
MVETARRRILLSGTPVIVMAGEVHYFRVARAEWQDRLDKLKEIGCTAVASYVPWLFHELPDGTIDVSGDTRPERDVGAFIDLCRDNGLWFIARPGPFIMAELKNEGLPFRLYREHPEIVSTGWDGRPAPTSTVDYLAPAFLAETERWYAAVLPVIAARLEPRGGNVIALQLDNEIGMLAWVSNSPDLTDGLLADFRSWCEDRHGQGLGARYPLDAGWRHTVESPQEQWAAALRVDLGLFMRHRFACYSGALAEMARAHGIADVPLLINIHGTEGGNGVPFGIGVSQLMETWSGVSGVIAGSDHYLGDMSLSTTTDIHFVNASMAAVNDADQPLTSLEFEVGTGDYSGGLEQLGDASTVDLKTRLCLAQGNRLINYYLLAGGINPPLDEPVGDGNDRISFTGERHGTAAPIGPEGQRGLTFAATRDACAAVRANAAWLADMDEEHDDLAMGFVPDAFATEYRYPTSAVMTAVVDDLAAHRGPGGRKALWRSLLLAGHRFSAVNLQDPRAPLPQVVALGCGRHLDRRVQERLVAHLDGGGGLLLLGLVPEHDLEDAPCAVLAEALGIRGHELVHGDDRHYPSLVGLGLAAAIPETRVGWLQPLDLGSSGATPLLTDVDGHVCGVEVTLGRGTAVLLTADMPSMPGLFAAIAARLGAPAGLGLTTDVPGVVVTSTRSPAGDRMVHLLNPTAYPARVELGFHGEQVGGGTLHVPARTGHLLGLGLTTPWGRIVSATAEVTDIGDDGVSFAFGVGDGHGHPGSRVVLQTAHDVRCEGAEVRREGCLVTLRHTGAPRPLTVLVGRSPSASAS